MPPIPVATLPLGGQIYSPLVADQARAAFVALNAQSGAGVLVLGTVTISGVTLTATSVIVLSRKTQGGTVTSTIDYEAPSASRNVGASTFVINAVVAAGTVNTPDTSTIDWLAIG